MLFVIPDWPCMAWYSPLHKLVTAEATLLPNLIFFLTGRAIHWVIWLGTIGCSIIKVNNSTFGKKGACVIFDSARPLNTSL